MCRYLKTVLLVITIIGMGTVAFAAINPPGTTAGTRPQIQGLMPNFGSSMEVVIVKGINIPNDKAKAEVWFTIAANKTTQGTIMKTSISQGLVSYWVQLPSAGDITATYQGPLYIKVKENGLTSNSVSFRFVPCPPAKITSHWPQYGKPGRTTTFRGTNFKSTDEAYFNNFGVVPMVFRSSTEITVTLPANFPVTDKLIKLYIRRKSGSTWVNGPQYTYAMDPSVLPESKPTSQTVGPKVEDKEGSSK
ncbi:MAG: IPT/TIG domain-containing protein [Armatimonadota bacterium]